VLGLKEVKFGTTSEGREGLPDREEGRKGVGLTEGDQVSEG